MFKGCLSAPASSCAREDDAHRWAKAEGQKDLLSIGKWMRNASAHIGLEESRVAVDVFLLLGRKRQKGAAPPGQEVRETRARLTVTLPSLDKQLLSISGGRYHTWWQPSFHQLHKDWGIATRNSSLNLGVKSPSEGRSLFQRKSLFQICMGYCFLRSGLGAAKLPFSTGPESWSQNRGRDNWWWVPGTLCARPFWYFWRRTLCFQHWPSWGAIQQDHFGLHTAFSLISWGQSPL